MTGIAYLLSKVLIRSPLRWGNCDQEPSDFSLNVGLPRFLNHIESPNLPSDFNSPARTSSNSLNEWFAPLQTVPAWLPVFVPVADDDDLHGQLLEVGQYLLIVFCRGREFEGSFECLHIRWLIHAASICHVALGRFCCWFHHSGTTTRTEFIVFKGCCPLAGCQQVFSDDSPGINISSSSIGVRFCFFPMSWSHEKSRKESILASPSTRVRVNLNWRCLGYLELAYKLRSSLLARQH